MSLKKKLIRNQINLIIFASTELFITIAKNHQATAIHIKNSAKLQSKHPQEKQKCKFKHEILKSPSMEPMKTLQLTSIMNNFNLVPLRIIGSALTSETAASIATFAALPITESKVKIAPMFTTAGLWQQTKPPKATNMKTDSGTNSICLIVGQCQPNNTDLVH